MGQGQLFEPAIISENTCAHIKIGIDYIFTTGLNAFIAFFGILSCTFTSKNVYMFVHAFLT